MAHKYFIALEVRDARREFGTADKRDAAYIKVRDTLASWGITTANASLMKVNNTDLYDGEGNFVMVHLTTVEVPPEEQLPHPPEAK